MRRTALTLALVLLAAPALADDAEPTHEERMTELFKRHDKDRNNVLRDDEIPDKWLDLFDSDADDEIDKREFLELQARPKRFRRIHPLRDVRARAHFDRRSFDRDNDGRVSREEYAGEDDVFDDFDRNGDGFLEWRELVKLAKEEIDDIRKKMRAPDRREFLRIFDLDGNNRVDAEEYDGKERVFRKYDTDEDGTVTYAELYPERMMGGSEAPPLDEHDVLGAMDTDEDGRVSREEFKGTESAWRRLDRNGDGVISKADRR